MKLVYLFFCFVLLSCSSTRNEYVCGDRPCVDKKEFEEFFSKNLTIEIKTTSKNKDKIDDLIILNTNNSKSKEITKKSLKQENKLKKKREKEKLKAEKIRVLEERKIKKAKKKVNLKNEKKIVKIKNNNKINNKKISEKVDNRNNEMKLNNKKANLKKTHIERVSNPQSQIDSMETKNVKSVCDEIKDCDIEKITDILTQKGMSKPFPSITRN